MTEPKKSYSIVCIARKGAEMGVTLLAMADRNKNPKDYWTSDDPEMVIKFASKEVAERVCSRLEHNNPEVVDYWQATDVVRAQAQCIRDYHIKRGLKDLSP